MSSRSGREPARRQSVCWNVCGAIRKALEKDRRILFRFNTYDRRGKRVPAGEPYVASPYYIVANAGHYYLIGAPDAKANQSPRMFIWRVDLMSKVQLTDNPRVPKREVENLPDEWTDDFQFSHLNMSYDKPEKISLRIRADDGTTPPYTFLRDWFGETWRCVGADKVEVLCSPFGMVNWAMQYADRVEVLAPEHVREEVKARIRKMREKYGV